MVSNLFFYQLMLIALVWLCLMLHGLWPSEPAAERLPTAPPILPSRKRSKVPKPFPGLTVNPTVMPARRTSPCTVSRPAPRHHGSSPPEGAAVKSTPRTIFVPTPIVAMAAGLVSATSVPMAIPAVAPGGNSIVAAVGATFLRPRARRCMANVSHPIRWCGPSRRWPKGSASAP